MSTEGSVRSVRVLAVRPTEGNGQRGSRGAASGPYAVPRSVEPVPQVRGSLAILTATTLRPARLHMIAVIAFGAIANLLALALPLYLIRFIDRVLPAGDIPAFMPLLTGLAVALLTVAVLDGVRIVATSRSVAWIDRHEAAPLLATTLREAWRRGLDIAQGPADLAALREELRGPASRVMVDLPWIVLPVAMLVLLHPVMGATAALTAIALAAGAWYATHRAGRALRAPGAPPASGERLEPLLRPSEAAAAMAMHRDLGEQWAMRRGALLDARDRADRMDDSHRIAGQVGLTLGCVVILGLAATLAADGRLTGGEAIAAMVLGLRAFAPLTDVIRHACALARLRLVLGRLRTSLAATAAPATVEAHRLPQGSLVVEDLWYRMPAGKGPALQRITFNARPGEAIAIVGGNGSGKSTLARLVAGLLEPDAGRIALGNVELSRLPAGVRGATVGWLSQIPDLYPGTIGENVRRMRHGSVDDTEAAARAAGAHEMILALPEGYATEVGTAGSHLSGGERQRVALARAMFGGPALLVLDEPCAFLDDDGRAALELAIRQAKARGAIVVAVTRSSAIPDAIDRVYQLDKGQLGPDAARSPGPSGVASLVVDAGPVSIASDGGARHHSDPGSNNEMDEEDTEVASTGIGEMPPSNGTTDRSLT